MTQRITKSERAELGSLIKKRERVMKASAAERAAKMLSEFEAQSAKIYDFDEDTVWKEATLRAKAAVAEAARIIEARCAELGIPPEFAPNISMNWYGRGQNALKDRQDELRRAAKAKISAIEHDAVTKIERMSLEAQTELLALGMESEAAKAFLGSLQTIETLMPLLNATEIKSVVDARHADKEAYDDRRWSDEQ